MTAVATASRQDRSALPSGRGRLLLVANWLHDVGGVQTATRELAAAFEAAGWTVRTASVLPPIAGARRPDVRTLFPAGAPAVLAQRLAGRRLTGTKAARLDPLGMRLAERRLRRAVDGADVVIAMDVLAAEILARVPGRGSARYLQFHNTVTSLEGTRDLQRILAVCDRLSGLVALTEADADGFRALGCSRVTAIGNAVSMPPPGEAQRERVVVGIGRYTGPKHFSLLIEAWSMLPARVRAGWTLELYGEGPEEQSLRALAAGDESVRIHPPSDDVLGLLRRVTLLALPSDFEGLPMVLLEAMTQGVGCIATASSPGVTALVGGAGWLTPVNDAMALAAAIEEAVTAPAELAARVDAASTRVQAFSPSAVVDRWADLIERPSR